MTRLHIEENCKGNGVPLLTALNRSCVYRGGFLGSCSHFPVTELFVDAMWAFDWRITKHCGMLASLLNVQLGGPTLLMKSDSLAVSNNSCLSTDHIQQKV